MVLQTWQFVLTIILALAGYPIGLLIAHLTKEELQQGKKWFKLIMLMAVVVIVASLLLITDFEVLIFMLSILLFIFLIALASFIKAKRTETGVSGAPKNKNFRAKMKKIKSKTKK